MEKKGCGCEPAKKVTPEVKKPEVKKQEDKKTEDTKQEVKKTEETKTGDQQTGQRRAGGVRHTEGAADPTVLRVSQMELGHQHRCQGR